MPVSNSMRKPITTPSTSTSAAATSGPNAVASATRLFMGPPFAVVILFGLAAILLAVFARLREPMLSWLSRCAHAHFRTRNAGAADRPRSHGVEPVPRGALRPRARPAAAAAHQNAQNPRHR